MPLSKEQIMAEAMKLDRLERAALAEELLLSIAATDREAIDAAWLAEAHQREAAFRARETTARPVDEAIRRLRHRDRL